jgi:hypothetical protein
MTATTLGTRTGCDELWRRAGQLVVSSVFGGLLVYGLQAIAQWQHYVANAGLRGGLFVWFVVYLAVAFLANDFGVLRERRFVGAVFDGLQAGGAFTALYALGFIASGFQPTPVQGIPPYSVAFLAIAMIALLGLIAAAFEASGVAQVAAPEKRSQHALLVIRVVALVVAVIASAISWTAPATQLTSLPSPWLPVCLAVLSIVLLVYAVIRLSQAAHAHVVVYASRNDFDELKEKVDRLTPASAENVGSKLGPLEAGAAPQKDSPHVDTPKPDVPQAPAVANDVKESVSDSNAASTAEKTATTEVKPAAPRKE